MGTTFAPAATNTTQSDGQILNVVATALGNANTSYTYIDWADIGYKYGSIQFVITATTLTIEQCNMGFAPGLVITGAATSTDGTGATLVCSTLNTANGFATNTDLIGAKVVVTADATTPTNVGLTRLVTAYTGASGTMTLDSALGATTSGVTQFQIIDNPAPFSRRVSDPTSTQWTDITSAVTGASTWTASGEWLFDTPLVYDRIRIKRVTTNATNALSLRLTRGR